MDNQDTRDSPSPPHRSLLATSPAVVQELAGDPRRQAVPSIQGTVYQAWASIDAWLQLRSADEVIYLEGAEDFDVVRTGGATAVQVKHRTGSISLGNQLARDALENFWTLANSEPLRRVELHYLTTSMVVVEQDANFGGIAGIHAWRAARTSDDYAHRISNYLCEKLLSTSGLAQFLRTASITQIQERIFGRFHWFAEQPDMETVKRSVLDRICVRISATGQPLVLAEKVRQRLESRFWEVVVRTPSSERCLTLGDLLLQIEEATTAYLPVPLHRVPDLLANQSFGAGLLELLLEKPVRPPEPLLRRPELVARVRSSVERRQAALLTGTVHKGKTTTAQLVAAELCPSAWWLNLTGRRADQVDTLLLALAARVDTSECPSLVILDDLDVTVGAVNVFGGSLQLVLYRIQSSGRALLITTQGAFDRDTAGGEQLAGIETVHIAELSEQEITDLCVEFDCPAPIVARWSQSIELSTRGHPKLVQVRIAELRRQGWPSPRLEDLFEQSPAVTSAKQLSRRLLSALQPEPVAEFLYMAAELTVPMDRSLALLLANSVPGLRNAGDVIDNLTGQWLERMEGALLRPTTLLRGAAADVWPKPRLQAMHAQLHDVIASKKIVNQQEAAALFFHAFMAGDRMRLAITAVRLQMGGRREVQRLVLQQLIWLPMIALGPGQTFTDDPFVDASIRSLQFRASTLLDEDRLPSIAERWIETVSRIQDEEMRVTCEVVLWSSVGFSESSKLTLNLRLSAVNGMRRLQDSAFAAPQLLRNFASKVPDLPAEAQPAQFMLVLAAQAVRSVETLEMLLTWLEQEAPAELKVDFESVLTWPITQAAGAFVHGAWAACHEEVEDWTEWIDAFDRIDGYAKRFSSPNFGREAAKAKAIVLTEHLSRSDDALQVLSEAERAFGPSAVLTEQRANVLFQSQDDEGVINVWGELRGLANEPALDPFAYRRIAMSAARLERFDLSIEVFLIGANSIIGDELPQTKFGLLIDAAIAKSQANRYADAAKTVCAAVAALPPAAREDGDARWEAVQRAAADACRQIEARRKRQAPTRTELQPGYVSSPALKVPEAKPRQRMRTDMLVLDVVRLAASLGVTSSLESEVRRGIESDIPYLRFLAAQAQLSIVMRDDAAEGFVTALVAFDRGSSDLATTGSREWLVESSVGHRDVAVSNPARWFGFIVAALCCATRPPLETLQVWHSECVGVTDKQSELSQLITTCIARLEEANYRARDDVFSPSAPRLLRCVAAKALLDEAQTPSSTIQLQGLLISGVVSDASYGLQELFNRHIATKFAPFWETHTQSPHSLRNPRRIVPELDRVCSQVVDGRATLRDLLTVGAEGAGVDLGEFLARVW